MSSSTKTSSSINVNGKIGSIKVLKANEGCCICYRKYTTTFYIEMNSPFGDSKIPYKLQVGAWNIHSLYCDPVDKSVWCNHHFCENCVDQLRDTAIDEWDDEKDDENVIVKCPICRCEYVVDEDYLDGYCKSLKEDREDEATNNAYCDMADWIEDIFVV